MCNNKVRNRILTGLCALSHSVMSNFLWPHGTVAHQALLSMDFFRQEYWKPCSRGSSWSRDRNSISWVSCIGRRFLYHSTTWAAPFGSLALLTRPKCREDGDAWELLGSLQEGRVLWAPRRPCLWIAHPGFLCRLETRLAWGGAEAGTPLLGPLLSSHNHGKEMGRAAHITDIGFSNFPHTVARRLF